MQNLSPLPSTSPDLGLGHDRVGPLVGLILEVPLVSPLALATSLHALDASRSLSEN